MTVPVEEDRRVVAIGLRLQRGKAPVLVVRPGLQANRDRVVGRAHPRADTGFQSFGVHSPAPPRIDVEARRARRVHARAGHVRHHVHVHVFADLVATQRLAHRLVEVGVRILDGEAVHLHGLTDPREMLLQPEDEELFFRLVPVRAQALEHVGAVEDGRAVDGQDGLGLGFQRPVHPDLQLAHRRSSSVGLGTGYHRWRGARERSSSYVFSCLNHTSLSAKPG